MAFAFSTLKALARLALDGEHAVAVRATHMTTAKVMENVFTVETSLVGIGVIELAAAL